MVLIENKKSGWTSRRVFVLAVICQSIGNSTLILPNNAIRDGAMGYMLCCIVVYISLGIPLLHMEFIVSQFTARDCIDVWKIRPFLSHIGYFQIAWQVTIILYNHAIATFLFHYILITYENAIPYYVCGPWATKDCNILLTNYTVNQECIKSKEPPSYCDSLAMTFPETQYWRYYVLGSQSSFHIAWRVCLASALTTIILFLSCFKGKQSIRWFVSTFAIYPVIGNLMLTVGSMLQKGFVHKYEDALDTNFNKFPTKFRISNIIKHVLYSLYIGVGTSFNLASRASFRSPCYSNVVIVVAACSFFASLATCLSAMMACPYAYAYKIQSTYFAEYILLSLCFERKPRLLHEYDNYSIWLLLSFSSDAALALSQNFVLLLNLIDVIAFRNSKVAKYPGLTCFVLSVLIFLLTIPLLGSGIVRYGPLLKNHLSLVSIFLAMIEVLVFVMWYGLGKICEDVHFMLGIPPRGFMKMAWMLSSVLLAYVFCRESYERYINRNIFSQEMSWWAFVFYIGSIILVVFVKILTATLKNKIRALFQLDPTWGPKSDLFLRSRAMFSAQAMTKEYMYRQYHLQAGIFERQRRSNVRLSQDH